MDFNKLTIKSQEAVAAAQELARRLGNPELYPEHRLLALLDQELPQQLVPDAAALRAETDAALRAKPAIQGASQRRLRQPLAREPLALKAARAEPAVSRTWSEPLTCGTLIQ